MDITNARKISSLESQYVPQRQWTKGMVPVVHLRQDIPPAPLRLYFDERNVLTKQERGILAVLDARLAAVAAELLATNSDARNKLRHASVQIARDAVAAGKPVPNFAEQARQLEERFNSAKLTRAILAADLDAVLKPIYRRLAEQLLKKRATIESDMIERAKALGLDLPLDCDPLLTVGATIGMLFARANHQGFSGNWQLPSRTFAELGLSLDIKN